MARGKIQMKRIENPVHRQVTFCKRRAGLKKKARELSVLCDADIGLLIFSENGKLFQLATKGTMQGMIDRYAKGTGQAEQPEQPIEAQSLDTKEEIIMLKQEIETLKKGIGYLFVGGGPDQMSLDELLVIEKHLEFWMCQTRSAKMDVMFQEIQMLKNKEEILEAANKHLQDTIMLETCGINNNYCGAMAANTSGLLTIPNDILQFQFQFQDRVQF